MKYHMGVARKQVLVQLDDELVDQLDALAGRLGVSRSELLRRGAQAVLHVEDWAAADRELVRAYRRVPPDDALAESLSRLAAESAPSW